MNFIKKAFKGDSRINIVFGEIKVEDGLSKGDIKVETKNVGANQAIVGLFSALSTVVEKTLRSHVECRGAGCESYELADMIKRGLDTIDLSKFDYKHSEIK